MRCYGLIGFPLSHSFSQIFFSEKFATEGLSECRYDLFPLREINELPSLLENNPGLKGLNVTIPYKQAVMPYLSGTDETASAAGAVNTIRIENEPEGRKILYGYNTDVHGFDISLSAVLLPHHRRALVLGTGGASKAACFILRKKGIPYTLVSRNPAPGMITYAEVEKEIMSSHLLVVNTTPLGMYPAVESYPALPYEYITPKHLMFDLVYNPQETLFLAKGKEMGAQVQNGMQMLKAQAEKAWEIWNAPANNLPK